MIYCPLHVQKCIFEVFPAPLSFKTKLNGTLSPSSGRTFSTTDWSYLTGCEDGPLLDLKFLQWWPSSSSWSLKQQLPVWALSKHRRCWLFWATNTSDFSSIRPDWTSFQIWRTRSKLLLIYNHLMTDSDVIPCWVAGLRPTCWRISKSSLLSRPREAKPGRNALPAPGVLT